MVSKVEDNPIIGRQLFDVITSGMYDNPLMIFREYVQNAVDSIDLGIEGGSLPQHKAQIIIQMQGQDRSITIQDNGPGLSNKEAHIILRSLGCSPKEGTKQRGFRGIGRLAGLAYCDELIFETRSSINEQVAVISWDHIAFEAVSSETDRFVSLIETIERVSTTTFRMAKEDEPHQFFKVTLKNVQRFHSDILMNVKEVSDYLSQIAPVPYNHERLKLAPSIENHLKTITDFKVYKITVNGREIKRPYADNFSISTNVTETINDIEFFTFNGTDNTPIALGWYAKTNFTASLPSNLNMRGIRVRQGNIEIGDEHFLDDKFTERRFASWQIGEIHIANNRLKPNARRDGFEQSTDFESFLEQAFLLGRLLSNICRKSSNNRIAKVRVDSTLQKLEQLFTSKATYLDADHYETALRQAHSDLIQIEKIAKNSVPEDLKSRYYELKRIIEGDSYNPLFLHDVLDGRRLRSLDQKELLKHVAKAVIESYGKSTSPEDILQTIFENFTKPTHTSNTLLAASGAGK